MAVVHFDNKRGWYNGLGFSLLSFMFGKVLRGKGVGCFSLPFEDAGSLRDKLKGLLAELGS